MKQTILLLLLAVSLNLTAQHSQYHEERLQTLIPSEIAMVEDLIKITDSISVWVWDTLAHEWIPDLRIIDWVYDSENRNLGSVRMVPEGTVWVNSEKYTYAYDATGNWTDQLIQHWNGGWINYRKTSLTYDAANNRTGFWTQNWNGSYWQNATKYLYTFDSYNNNTSFTMQMGSDTSWVNQFQRLYTYNDFNSLDTMLERNWNNSDWKNQSLHTYTYDADTNLVIDLQQSWSNNAWKDSYMSSYTYDGQGNKESKLTMRWQNEWLNSQLITYTYDANKNLTGYLAKEWYGSWTNLANFTVLYDDHSNRIYSLYQDWVDSSWFNFNEEYRTFDPNNLLTTMVYTQWESNGVDTILHDTTHYYFHTIIGINDHYTQKATITVYPNPSSGRFTIQCNSELSMIEIYNLTGQMVMVTQVCGKKEEIQMETSTLPGGIYLLKFFSGNKLVGVEKVIIR